MKQTLILLVISTLSVCLQAQTYTGKVVDAANNQPLDIVSVSITDADNMTLSYTATDEKGAFTLECKNNKEAKYIYISSLGYQAQKIVLSDYKNNTQIALFKADIKLKEVKVKFESIKQSGDTLNYAVSAFRLGQDRSIRDVLKRLPGIEVEDNGQIKYEGKAINRFYVENMDVTDGRYNLISNNLAAKSVKTVQILEKHQPVNALQGITFSDRATLNLVLEDAAKGKLVGIADIGLGAEHKSNQPKAIWKNRLIALLFKNKVQNVSLYKNANTGSDIKEDLTDFKTGVSIIGDVTSDDMSSPFSPLSASSSLSFKKQRYFFNDAHFVSQNTLAKLSKNSLLRMQASYLHEKETQRSASSVAYLLPNDTISVIENANVKNYHNQIDCRITYELNGKKDYIKSTVNFSAGLETDNGEISGSDSIWQRMNLDRYTFSNDFSLVHRINQDKAFKFSTVSSFDRLPQQIIVLPGLYSGLSGGSIEDKPMVQNVTINSFNSHSFTSFSHSLFMFGIDSDLGIDLKNQLLESSTDASTSALPDNFTDSLSNKIQYTNLSVYLSPAIRYQREYLKISLSLKSTLLNLHSNDMFRNQTEKSTRLLFEPAFSLYYDINAYWEFGISSSFNKNYSDIRNLYTGYILNFYRSISKYENKPSWNAVFGNSFNISYKQPIKGFFINLSGSFSRKFQNSLPHTAFDGIIQKNSSKKANTANNNYMTNIRLSKTLPFWSSVISLKHNFMRSEFTQDLSDIQSHYSTKINSVNTSLTLSPIRTFNLEGNAKILFQQLQRTTPSAARYPIVRSEIYDLSLNFVPNPKITFSLGNEVYHNSTDNKTTFYSDFTCSFHLKRNEIQLIVNNLFNESKYEKYSISSYSQTYNLSYLHQRQILIKYSFNL